MHGYMNVKLTAITVRWSYSTEVSVLLLFLSSCCVFSYSFVSVGLNR